MLHELVAVGQLGGRKRVDCRLSTNYQGGNKVQKISKRTLYLATGSILRCPSDFCHKDATLIRVTIGYNLTYDINLCISSPCSNCNPVIISPKDGTSPNNISFMDT